ncbi:MULTISPECIES: stage V sporulation protein AA [Bacillaceae]|jgi:stage V sporulation protein AA|uniref:stage V sporulation protein AA n=1 Tax=Bacillaceae TaxID=186817 RepID=UPI00054E67C7|nr:MULTISPECIES: stage V sporulation protein AA [Bacillaceae]MCA0147747.1 stage V sporulation protein AA [Rossellomorea vietnamensis]MCC5800335.1 stage V sporulation protein AA [Rossellomorea vietnamensis]PFG05843.1 stage V sporulation protein AA [Bacillus sp. es.034]UTE76210.1 stage V sporulation protein AA [Rossellomorea sp. KS-H15a]WGG44051.1 stage V sporulation protein AA [Rossellomorea sp. DA94]
MEGILYIRLRHRVQVREESMVKLSQLAQIIASETIVEDIKEIPIHQVTPSDKNIVVVDVMKVISEVCKVYPDLDIQTIGPTQSIIEVIYEKKKVSLPLFIGVWLLLFIGAALAIMNFHEDVSMREVHQRLYHFVTGGVDPHPLLFQVPYSFGLGLGMILFFNHVFRKRLNEEPSPLEVEMFNYQQDLDQYVIMHENKESQKKLDDH